MITIFSGTAGEAHQADKILAACAFEAAYGFGKHVLVLQFCSGLSIEKILNGSRTIEQAGDWAVPEDSGMEMLLRKAGTGGLKEKHFSMYTRRLLISGKGESRLDVASTPSMDDFGGEIVRREEALKNLLNLADTMYNHVFVLADGSKKEEMEILLRYSRQQIICVGQRSKESIFGVGDNCFFVIDRFDPGSIYTLRNRMRCYQTKQMMPIPYDSDFQDACAGNDLMQYLFLHHGQKEKTQRDAVVLAIQSLTALILGKRETVVASGITRISESVKREET